MTMNESFKSFWHSFKKYTAFSRKEINALVLGILIMGFIISFDEWGVESFDILYGLRNLLNAILIVTLAVLVKQVGQRASSIHSGFRPEYRPWMYGLIFGLILAFVSQGRIWFLVPGGLVVYHLAGHRLGSFRYGLSYWPLGIAGLAGPVSSILLAIFFKIMMGVFPANLLLEKAFVFNLWFAAFSALPIPPLDGSHMFFASRMFYMFAFGTILGLCAALYYLPILWAILLGVIVGVIVWMSYLLIFEPPGK